MYEGIILAGGAGSRLFPLTLVASTTTVTGLRRADGLLSAYGGDPEGGIRELCLISTPHDLPRFRQLLRDGSRLGLAIEYREQARLAGNAQTRSL